MNGKKQIKVFLINAPEEGKLISRDMAGGLGFDRTETTVLPPLDLLSFATYLDLKGFLVTLLDSQVESLTNEQIIQNIISFHPDVVISTVSLPSIDNDISFAKQLRNRLSSCKIILKTSIRFPSILEKILKNSGCDYCIIGECDLIIDKILTNETDCGTARLLEGRYNEKEEALLDDLDKLPVLNRKFLKNERYTYYKLGPKTTTMQTSRGCPFSCAYYCPYPLVQGRKWRAMSANRIFLELEKIVAEQGIKNIFFRDATFTFDKKGIQELCRLILNKSLDIRWWCETRVDCLDLNLLNLMKKAGCAGMNVGIETGDEKLMADIAKQGLKLDYISKLTQHCKKIGIKLRFLFMLGLPGETKISLYETFKLVDQLNPDLIATTTVTPYPGTPLYADAIMNNWIIDSDFNTFGGHGYNLQIDPLTPKDLEFALNKIHEIYTINRNNDTSSQIRKKELYQELLNWINIGKKVISK